MKRTIGFFLILLSSFASADVAVIVNPAAGDVSADDIQRLFLGKKSSFSNGGKATPYYLPDNTDERKVFEKEVLKKLPSQIKSYWSKLVFTGKGTPPKILESSEAAIAKVAKEKGAIAYVNASLVNDSVKVVATYK